MPLHARLLFPALLLLAAPLQAQSGTCVIGLRDRGAAVQAKGGLKVGDCFTAGQEVVTPPGAVAKLVTPLGDTITVNGRLRIKEQSPKGQSFWVRNGSAAFNVVAKQVSFFSVEGQNGNRSFQAAVKGTTFEMAVDEGKRVTLTPQEGQIQVTRAVKVGIAGAEGRREGAGAPSERGGPGSRAAQALKPDRSDLLAGSYAGKTELVSGGGAALEYALDEDDVLSFDTVEECVAAFTAQAGSALGSEGHRNLGDCYLEDGNPSRALSEFGKALEINKGLHPDGVHPDIADDYRSLADARAFTDPARAIAELKRAMSIDLQLYGDEPDPDVSEDHRTLADFYLLLDQPGQSIEELQAALAIDQQLYPDGLDFDLAEDYRMLGEAHTLAAAMAGGGASHLASAVSAFQQALAIDRQLLDGDADADLAEDFRGLGYAYLLGGDEAHAFDAFHQALATGLALVGVTYRGDPASVDLRDLDLDSDDVEIDDVENLYDDAENLADLADALGHADQSAAFEHLASQLDEILESD